MKFWGNNPELDPKSITAYSSQVVNWKCPDCGYEWSSTVYSKTTLKAGCPRCSKQIASSEYNAKVLFPDLLDYYDFDFPDNPPLESLRPTSRKIVHWHCQKCGYKWEQPLNQRIRRNKGRHRVAECPVCAGTSVKGINTGLPDYLVMEWCYEKNEKRPDGIRPDSTANYWWKCQNGHIYKKQPKERVYDHENGIISCPICDGRKVIKGTSFASKYPETAKEWDYEKNVDLAEGPEHVSADSVAPYYWKCDKGHEYRLNPATISERLEKGQEPCHFCDNRRTLEGYNSLDITNPKIVEEWSSGNEISPGRVQKRYTLPILWICPVCGGEYEARICDREVGDDSCPYCADNKVLPGYYDLATTHPDIIDNLCKAENILIGFDPTRVGSERIITAWWKCNDCKRKYTAKVCDVTLKIRRGHNSCPYCNGRRQKTTHFMEFKI